MEYEDFELQVGPQSGEGFHVRVVRSPAGKGSGFLRLPDLPGAAPWLEADPAAVGAALFRALFNGPVANLVHASLPRGSEAGLRLRLEIDPRDPAVATLHQVPWELLYREETEDFLALGLRTPVVRSFDIPRSVSLPPFEPPLRLLAVLSPRRRGDDELKLETEFAELEKSFKDKDIEVEPLRDLDPRALRNALTRKPFHVLHYVGHGGFDPQTGEGALVGQGPGGRRITVTGRHLATKLQDLDSLRLVVLNACETALASAEAGHNPFAGVATALVLGGIPAVVAMQSPIEDDHALAFSAAFYDRLAHGLPIEEAITEGRQAIHSLDPETADWAVPVLFLRTPTGDLFRVPKKAAAEPALRDRTRRRTAILAVGLALTLGLSHPAVPGFVLGVGEPEQVEPWPGPKKKEARRKVPASPTPVEKPPPPPRLTRTITVGEFRFQVTADSRIAEPFTQALRRAAAPLASFGIPGQTVRLEVGAPRIESSNDGLSSKACRLSVTGRPQAGDSFTVPVTRAQADEETACAMAAEVLAQAVADRLAQSP